MSAGRHRAGRGNEGDARRMARTVVVAGLAGLLAATVGGGALAHDQRDDAFRKGGTAGMFEETRVDPPGRAPAHSHRPGTASTCTRGKAAGAFACQGVDLLAHVDLATLGQERLNDVWSWADPATGREYALVGGTAGVSMVDVTDPLRPTVRGLLPARWDGEPEGAFWNEWRDMAVGPQDHVYVVSEAFGSGLQVFDLRRLRTESGVLLEDGASTAIEWAHNVTTDPDRPHVVAASGAVGFAQDEDGHWHAPCPGGLHFFDASVPAEPAWTSCYGGYGAHGYIHDVQCVTYHGPDGRFHGRNLCLVSSATWVWPDGVEIIWPDDVGDLFRSTIAVIDVTDVHDVRLLSELEYERDGYSHQAWFTEDHRYALHNDEIDEWAHGDTPTLRIFDFTNLEEPRLLSTYASGAGGIDHNVFVDGRFAYQATYTTGLQVFDLQRIAQGTIRRVAHFDTVPWTDEAEFWGAWGVTPYFEQPGLVAVSSIDEGLFLLRHRGGR